MISRTPRTWRGILSPGRDGTAETLRMMRALTLEGSRDPLIGRLAAGIVNRTAAHASPHAQLSALFAWVRDRVRYVRDPAGTEQLQAPWYTATRRRGDCDDKSILLAALIHAAQLPFRVAFRTIGTNPARPDRFSHVYTVVSDRNRTIALDATHVGTPIGWEYPRPTMLEDFAT